MSSSAPFRERVGIDLLRWFPKAAWSRCVGWAAQRNVPHALRASLYTHFAREFGIDLGEVDRALEDFRSLDEFFTRPLRPGCRTIAPGADVVVSPCDGTLSEVGIAEGGRLIQCKGRDYTLSSLLADSADGRAFVGGAYATIYLSPRDYHRVHAPCDGAVSGYRYVPGAFFPVNPASVRHVAGLYSINERLITFIEGPLGRVALVMVAAIGVSHITVAYDTIQTHPRNAQPGAAPRAQRYVPPRPIAKGAELGTFHLGSTVVLVFQPGKVTLSGLQRGQRMLLGQPLGYLSAGRSGEVAA